MVFSKEFWASAAYVVVSGLVAFMAPVIVGKPVRWMWLPFALSVLMLARQYWVERQQELTE